MKNQILSLIFVISVLTGFSQTMPTHRNTSNMTPVQLSACSNENFQTADSLLVPVGDSVWIGNIDVWNFNWLGYSNGQNIYLVKETVSASSGGHIDTVAIGNNDEYRFKVSNTTKYRYKIYLPGQATADMIFYIRGTMGVATGILSHDNTKTVLNAFPNPTSDHLNISGLTKNQKTLLIINMLGEVVNKIETDGAESLSIDTKNLTPGVYFIKTDAVAFKFIKN